MNFVVTPESNLLCRACEPFVSRSSTAPAAVWQLPVSRTQRWPARWLTSLLPPECSTVALPRAPRSRSQSSCLFAVRSFSLSTAPTTKPTWGISITGEKSTRRWKRGVDLQGRAVPNPFRPEDEVLHWDWLSAVVWHRLLLWGAEVVQGGVRQILPLTSVIVRTREKGNTHTQMSKFTFWHFLTLPVF